MKKISLDYLDQHILVQDSNYSSLSCEKLRYYLIMRVDMEECTDPIKYCPFCGSPFKGPIIPNASYSLDNLMFLPDPPMSKDKGNK